VIGTQFNHVHSVLSLAVDSKRNLLGGLRLLAGLEAHMYGPLRATGRALQVLRRSHELDESEAISTSSAADRAHEADSLAALAVLQTNHACVFHAFHRAAFFTRLAARRFGPDSFKASTLECADELMESLRPMAERRDVQLALSRLAGLDRHTRLAMDADHFLFVAHTLLTNAIDSTPPGSSICVVLEPHQRGRASEVVRLWVVDTGAPVPAEVRAGVIAKDLSLADIGELVDDRICAGRSGDRYGVAVMQAIARTSGGQLGVCESHLDLPRNVWERVEASGVAAMGSEMTVWWFDAVRVVERPVAASRGRPSSVRHVHQGGEGGEGAA